MITISDILKIKEIDLHLAPANPEETVYNVAMLLRQNEHVKDWQAFYDGLKAKDSCILETPEVRLCIPHTRTKSIDMMVMSVGRSLLDAGEGKKVVQYTFVIGVPIALASDYLRIIGALARIFKDNAAEARLRVADSAKEFLTILTQKEVKL